MDISSEHVRIKNTIASKLYNQSGVVIQNTNSGLVVANSYFTLSALNKLIVIGCDEFAIISPVSGIEGKNITSGCMGCCSTSVPAGLNTYIATVSTLNNHKNIWHFNKWGYAFLGEQSAFTFRGASDFTDPDFLNRTTNTVPVVLDWVIGRKDEMGNEEHAATKGWSPVRLPCCLVLILEVLILGSPSPTFYMAIQKVKRKPLCISLLHGSSEAQWSRAKSRALTTSFRKWGHVAWLEPVRIDMMVGTQPFETYKYL
ncbi:EGF-like calcium-binding [Artemisia annua]|uniref:EGF-like calcium-binding n=1 Tax=Artemisia annua TaxID=35608 RepID=A0A2U1KQJ7_ARTAN|nr:EGF-like calcium-binding [Artemisia annua]